MRVQTSKIKHGSAVFDAGTTTKITSTQNINLADTSFTVEYWIKLNESALHRDHFSIGIRDTSTGWPTRKLLHLGYRLSSNGSTNMWFGFYADDASLPVLNRTEILKWQHHTFTYDSATKTKSIYLNGILIGTAISGDNFKGNAPLQIGQADTTTGINGCVDEVRVWNYARTAEQIKANYKTTIEPQTGLVAYYKLDGNALDGSGNGNHGTVNGGVTWSTTDIAPDLEKIKLHTRKGSDGKERLLTSVSKYKKVMGFSGTSLNIIQAVDVDFSQDHSIGAWVKLDTFNADYRGVLSISGIQMDSIQLMTTSVTSNRWQFQTAGAEGNRVVGSVGYNVSDNLGKWAFLVATYEAATMTRRFYTNGVLSQTTTATLPVGTGQRTNITFGAGLIGASEGIFIWNKILSTEEVKGGFLGTVSITGLKHWWVTDDNNGVKDKISLNPITYPNGNRINSIPSTAPIGQRSGLKCVNTTVVIPHTTAMESDSFTIGGWYRVRTLGGNSHLIRKEANFFLRSTDSAGNIQYLIDSSSGSILKSTTNTPLKLGRWQHILLSYDSTTRIGALIVDGVIVDTAVLPGTVKRTVVNTSLALGSAYVNNVPSNFYNGEMGNTIFLDKALTETEAKSIMYSYLPANYPNLIEQWKLNEGIGNIAYGTKGNNGTITGATWTTPSLMNYVGKHVKFNGTRQPVIVNHSNSLDITRQITIEGWIYQLTEDTTHGKCLLSKGLYNANDAYYELSAAGVLHFRLSTTNGVTSVFGGVVPINTWTHIAGTYDGATLRVYINGALVASQAATGAIISTTQAVSIGQRYRYYQEPGTSKDLSSVNGSLDEVRVWDIARTQAEIQENMYKTIDRHPNLILNMGFESGYWDASGYGNHGTAVGSPVIEVTDNDKLLLNAPIN